MSKPTTNVYADKIFRGGTILTMKEAPRTVKAIAIANGEILAVGEEAEVMKTRNDATEIIDLGGNTLMPSFIDAHGHFMNAIQVLDWVNVSGPPAGDVEYIAQIIQKLKDHATQHNISPEEWIIGYGYDRSNIKDKPFIEDSYRELTAEDLDGAKLDNPVMLIHSSNHGAVLNSKAFEIVGYNEMTPDPEGGVIRRADDKPDHGTPEGLIMENAFLPVFGNMPQPSDQDLFDKLDAAQQMYARVGVTTCQEGATHEEDLKFLRKAAQRKLFYLDIVSLPFALDKNYYSVPQVARNTIDLHKNVADEFGKYKNRLKLAGVKITVDGSVQGKTAFWTRPLFKGGPNGETNWKGEPLLSPEELNAAVKEFYDKDIQIFSHCNGDAAIDMMIDAARAARIEAKDDRRTVIIHSQCMRREPGVPVQLPIEVHEPVPLPIEVHEPVPLELPEKEIVNDSPSAQLAGNESQFPTQLESYVELGFSPSFFTVHTFFWGLVHIENLGEERASFISPMRSAIDKGLRCSNHNDYSITPMEPMRMVWSAVARETRRDEDGNPPLILGKDERITPWEALKAITIEAAWQIKEDDKKGTLDVGKLADLVILDGNPLAVATDEILNIQVNETFKEGKRVYLRPVTLPGSLQ